MERATNATTNSIFGIICIHPQCQNNNISADNISNTPNFLIPNENKDDDPIPLTLSSINSFITSSEVPQTLKQELISKLKKNKNYKSFLKNKISIKPTESNTKVRSRTLFTKEEDEKIQLLVDNIGTREWPLISTFLDGRTAKQCRDRYVNYLKPGVFRGEWTNEEDEIINKLYIKYGPKWSFIRKSLPNRTTKSIQNHWNYYLSKRSRENQ